MTINTKSILIVITGITISIILICILKPCERTTLNILSIIGTFASLIGLGITYVQIKEIKTISEENKTVINETKKEITFVLSLSESVQVSHLIQEIQSYLRDSKLELAHSKMKDLKRHLVHFKSSKKFVKVVTEDNKNFSGIITDISTDIGSLSDKISIGVNDDEIDIKKINKNLEYILGYILDFEEQTKNEKLNQ